MRQTQTIPLSDMYTQCGSLTFGILTGSPQMILQPRPAMLAGLRRRPRQSLDGSGHGWHHRGPDRKKAPSAFCITESGMVKYIAKISTSPWAGGSSDVGTKEWLWMVIACHQTKCKPHIRPNPRNVGHGVWDGSYWVTRKLQYLTKPPNLNVGSLESCWDDLKVCLRSFDRCIHRRRPTI